ncbi:MAG: ABC transporter permease [Gemmatimonadetes bacterium]|nr:ABC transporter permease [Gemmatimonadota bacterium]
MASPLPRWPELVELTRHRILTFLRQPESVFWVFAFPLLLSGVLGFAFQGGDPAPSRIGVIGEAQGWAARLAMDPSIALVRYATREEAERELAGGHIDALVLAVAPAELRLDPSRAEAEVARLRVLVALGEIDQGQLTVAPVTERGARYVDFLFPGLLGMNLMGTGLWSIGFTVADMRQRKVLKRLLVTPMRRSSFLSSLIGARLAYLAGELALLTAFGVWVLGVPLRTSLFTFFAVSVFGAVAFSCLGLLVVSRTKTIEGISGLVNLVIVPMWLGSGVFFSYERFPEAIHPLLRALPLTALNDALRAGMIDGAGLGSMLPELAVLAAWMVIPFVLALKVFRWA